MLIDEDAQDVLHLGCFLILYFSVPPQISLNLTLENCLSSCYWSL